MKVTTELKNLIKRQFEDKKNIAEKEYREQGKIKYQEELESFKQTDVYKNYIASVNELKKYLETCSTKYDCYSDYPYYYNDNVYFKYSDDMLKAQYNYSCCNLLNELDRKRDSLLIKLTYEKDFDKVQELLKEYGIEL